MLDRRVPVPTWLLAVCLLTMAVLPTAATLLGVRIAISRQQAKVVVVYPRQRELAGYTPVAGPNPVPLGYTGVVTTEYTSRPRTSFAPGILDPIKNLLDPAKVIPNIISAATKAITGQDLPLKVPEADRQNTLTNPPPLFATVMQWLSHTPDFTASGRGDSFIRGLQIAAFSLLMLAIAVLAIRYMTGAEENVGASALSIGVIALAIGLYPQLWHLGTEILNTIGDGIYQNGLQFRGWSDPALSEVPGGIGLRALLVLLEFFAILAVGLVRGMTLLMLGVAFLAGPLAIGARAFGSNPVWSVWFNNVLRACLWPLVWSLEASVFVLFSGTYSFIPSVSDALFQPLIQIGLVYAMIKTPSWINTGFAMAQPRASRAANRVGTVVTRTAVARSAVAGAANPAAGVVTVGLAGVGLAKHHIEDLLGRRR